MNQRLKTQAIAAAVLTGIALLLAVVAGANGKAGSVGILLLIAVPLAILAVVLYEWGKRRGVGQ